MALLVKKRIGNPSGALAEKMNLLASLQPQEDEDDMEFGFEDDEEDEEDYDEDEDAEDVEDDAVNGPPPDDHDEVIPEMPPVAALPPKKPLRKPLVVMPEASAVEAPLPKPAPASAPAQRHRKAAREESSEKVQLGCKISRSHHSRLKIHSIVTGQSVLSILEEWIGQHCPPL